MILSIVGLLMLGFLSDPVPADQTWPQWRGPTGNSVAPASVLPTKWGPSQNIAWKTPIPGWGDSTPAIWQDAVFVTTQDEDRLLLLRIDRRLGNIVWQQEVGRGKPRRSGALGNGRFHDEQNLASPSPITDGRHVWAHFGNGDLACYDMAGAQVWSVNLPDRFGPYTIWWGHANSPCVVDGLIVSVCMQDPKNGGKSYVVAHDKETGQERWFVKRETGATEEPADAYTTPVAATHNVRTELVVLGGQVLNAYDPATGKELWRSTVLKGNRVIPSPTAAGDTVYAVQGMRGPLFAIQGETSGAGSSPLVRWKYTGATPDAASPLVAHGLVFLATNDGMGVCLDAATGAELWKERLAKAFRASPLAVGNNVYFFGKDGRTTVVEAARAFKEVARSELGEETMASPAAAGGSLFIRTRGYLYRIMEAGSN